MPAHRPDGPDLRALRPESPTDRAAVGALVTACSPDTLGRRFFRGGLDPARAAAEYLPFLLPDAAAGRAVLASVGGYPAGLLTVVVCGGPRHAEVALLVADARQRSGVGTHLLRHGLRTWPGRRLSATVQRSNAGAVALLRAVGPAAVRVERDHGHGEYAVVLDPPPRPTNCPHSPPPWELSRLAVQVVDVTPPQVLLGRTDPAQHPPTVS